MADGRSRSQSSWILAFGCIALALCAGPRIGAEDYSRAFLQAMSQYTSDSPAKRAAGEKKLRRLGRRIVPELKRWVSDTQENSRRARGLLAELDDGSPSVEADIMSEKVGSFFARKLDEAWKLLLDGDHDGARRIANSLEILDSRSARVYEYRRLRRAAKKRMLVNEVLEPAVEFRERVYEVGETPVVIFRLHNHQDRQLVIRSDRGVLGSLELTMDRSLVSGSQHREVKTFPVKVLNERVVLPPGRAYEQQIPIEVEDSMPTSGMVIRLRMVGKFRPTQWGVGEENVSETLELPVSECWIVPEKERELALTPLRKLEASLVFRDIQTFFTAGQLAVWAASEDSQMNERLIELLVTSLDDLDEHGYAIADRFLRQAADVPRRKATTPGFWSTLLENRK